MSLSSNFFKDDPRLQACAREDRSHVTRGSIGPHVSLIQQALNIIDGLAIAQVELEQTRYGDSTAAAVLAYKRKRKIINRSYQSKEDDVVGKMTIDSLDKEIKKLERPFEVVTGGGPVLCAKTNVGVQQPRRAPEPPQRVRFEIASKALGDPDTKIG